VADNKDQVRWGAVVPAAGVGRRMKSGQPKQLIMLGHRPILIHTLIRLAACPLLKDLVVAAPAKFIEEIKDLIDSYGVAKVRAVVAGGATRQESVSLGLAALDPACDYVVIHDGVRPLVDRPTLDRVMTAAREIGAVTAGIPVQDTLAGVDKKRFIGSMPSRSRLWQVQTPQAFWRPLLAEAQAQAREDDHLGTDEAGLVVRLGRPVRMVAGSPLNLKLTTPQEFKLAEAILGLGEN